MKFFKKKRDIIRYKGVIVRCLPFNKYEALVNKKKLIVYLCGKMVKNSIRIMLRDEVLIEFNKFYLDKGRIVYRY